MYIFVSWFIVALVITEKGYSFPKSLPCQNLLVSGLTTEPLERPALPDLKPPPPGKEQVPKVEPKRKSVPRPMPDRPLKPTVDPKDILVKELYTNDHLFKEVLKKFPPELLENLERARKREFEDLKKKLLEYQVIDVSSAVRVWKQLKSEFENKERGNRNQIQEIIQKMVKDNYGDSVEKAIEIKISDKIPSRTDSNEGNHLKDSNFLSTLSFKRELYNSLSQAAGWSGMVQFFRTYETELNAIKPGLAKSYEKFHLLFRFIQHESLAGIASADYFTTPGIRDSFAAGREIVTATPREFVDENGEQRVEIESMKAVAVGVDGWAAAHEANKAGFELATILESVGRMPLTSAERDYINDRTNSVLSELRQGLYGVAIDKLLRRSLALMLYKNENTGIANADYLLSVERIFSQLPPAKFEEFMFILLSEKFYTDTQLQQKAQLIASEFGIFEDL